MKLILKLLSLISLVGYVSAEPLQYYGTPFFYGKYTSNYYNCYYDITNQIGECDDDYGTEEAIVGYTTGTEQIAYNVKLFTEVICNDGNCYSKWGEPYGEVAITGISYWYVPKGFYLAGDVGTIKAFKHGSGPLAASYPISHVQVLPALDDAPKGHVGVSTASYDVYCNAAEECSYLNIEMTYSELINLIPKVMTTNCDQYFCYSSNQTIVGLNPRS